MLTLGIDVLILLMVAGVLLATAIVATALLPLTLREGHCAVVATAITAFAMVAAYVVMAEILDWIVGVCW